MVPTVEQFNTDEDAAKLQAVYKKSGSDGLIAAMRKMDQGTVDIEGVRTARVHYVRVREGKDGDTVVMVADKLFLFSGRGP